MALGEDATLRVLLELLGQHEQQQVPVGGERLDTANLYSIFGEYLYRDAVDERMSRSLWNFVTAVPV